jgi:hypothetical protein
VKRFGAFSVTLLLLAAVGCGSSPRQLQSINITPATASGQAQFVTNGRYNHVPLTLSPVPALRFTLPGGTAGATVTQNGAAQCNPGASGTVWIFAYAPADPNIPITKFVTAKKVVRGSATLTCP